MRMSLAEQFWTRIRPAHVALFPASLLFRAIVAVRRTLYARGIFRSAHPGVPVVVVGNLSVGGTGKTPLVIWLAHTLRARGFHPGILTRGHGGSGQVQPVRAESDPARAGDEPVLLAQRSGCPVWVGRDRPGAARALLAAHPECDVLISDDGLQHYALQRDVEIAVVDGARHFGNGLLLPAGPLREPVRRLRSVDAVVVNGGGSSDVAALHPRQFDMRLEGPQLVNLLDPARAQPPEAFAGRTLFAVAGIGHPPRFFAHLRALGLAIRPQPFPDHFAFTAEDLAFAGEEPLVMTEKDAVKCRPFARSSWWVLPVEAQADPRLADLVIAALKARHGRKAP
jgi:tetraacyldisaccharide 4'-kinase